MVEVDNVVLGSKGVFQLYLHISICFEARGACIYIFFRLHNAR